MFRYFLIFFIGLGSTFTIFPSHVFDQNSIVLSTFYRVGWGLFVVFVTWLVQTKRKKVDVKIEWEICRLSLSY